MGALKLWLVAHALLVKLAVLGLLLGGLVTWHYVKVAEARAEGRAQAEAACELAQAKAIAEAVQAQAKKQADIDAQAEADRKAREAEAEANRKAQAQIVAGIRALSKAKPLPADCRADPERVDQVNKARGK